MVPLEVARSRRKPPVLTLPDFRFFSDCVNKTDNPKKSILPLLVEALKSKAELDGTLKPILPFEV